MKHIAIILIALLANLAVGSTSVTVYGYGSDRELAKKDAFKTAIENVCGVAVLSDREHFNSNTTHNQVLSYSSCSIQSYEILEYKNNRMRIKVTLANNKISRRLHSESNHRLQFDTFRVKDQLDTWRFEQIEGDKLIDEVFRDYPYRAYNLNNAGEPYLTSDGRRNIYLMVPYDITWNYNFVSAMNDTFSLFGTKRGQGSISVTSKDPKNKIFGSRSNYHIDDISRLEHIKSKLSNQNEMRLKIMARDSSGKNILNVCYNPEYKAGGIFYSIGVRDNLTIFGNDRNKGTVQINLTFPADVIFDVYVDVVADRDCKL